jgi:hypothetical protein
MLLLIALIAPVSASSAQRPPVPRIGRRPTPEPATLPPQAGPVARSLAYRRSRWSAEGYSIVSRFQIPQPNGAIAGFTSVGSGTHADYRYNQHWSATVDVTAAVLGSPAHAETAELGTRYSPLSLEQTLRPYIDVRAGYMHMFDPFSFASFGDPSNGNFGTASRYSRGFGGVTGGGFEYALSRSMALTTQVSVMRTRMTTYRISPGVIPDADKFWMTTVRYTLGFKINPVRALYFQQSPRQ